MPRRRTPSPPSYCQHKASGQAVVRINGKDVYLGPHGSPESHSAYARVIAEFTLPGEASAHPAKDIDRPEPADLTISQVILRYRDFAKVYYSKDGEPTKEYVEVKYTLRVLRLLYGDLPARDFGPKKLKAVRQHMIDERDWSRGVVNKRIKRSAIFQVGG